MGPGENILESEPILTKKLSMSRETLRKAISELSQEGLISRWHGKGNFGHPAVSRLPMRFDLNSNFRLLLEKAGFKVLSTRTNWQETAVPEALAKRAPDQTEAHFIQFQQYFTADGQLSIISDVYINQRHLMVYPEAGVYQDNIDNFFQTHCTMKSEYVVAWPKAEVNHQVAGEFNLPLDTPMLSWEEIYYNINDEIMGLIEVHFNPHIMDLSMLLHFS